MKSGYRSSGRIGLGISDIGKQAAGCSLSATIECRPRSIKPEQLFIHLPHHLLWLSS